MFIYSWLLWVFAAAHRLSLVAASQGYSLVALGRLTIVVASAVAERGLYSIGAVVVVNGFSCLAACGILSDQEWNP